MENSIYRSYRALTNKVLLFLTFFCIALFVHAQTDSVLVYIRDDVYIDYLKFVDDRDTSLIDDFSGENIRRDVVDMIIAQQALKLGGFNHHFTYAPGKVNFRNTKMLQNGQLLISFDSYWQQDALPLFNKLYTQTTLRYLFQDA
tara:strand:- start:267 stop:698 length:432 start_codon:yes stop_codon:yes gene_type:complete